MNKLELFYLNKAIKLRIEREQTSWWKFYKKAKLLKDWEHALDMMVKTSNKNYGI
tara:strand:+ start:481 stop:645 length:165 start_codon:yes stop_codon:yes gene_type:complete